MVTSKEEDLKLISELKPLFREKKEIERKIRKKRVFFSQRYRADEEDLNYITDEIKKELEQEQREEEDIIKHLKSL